MKRPWGEYTVLGRGEGFLVKALTVQPHQRLSLQYHMKRSEQWIIVKGELRVTVDDDHWTVYEGSRVTVHRWSAHRIENPTNEPATLIEVQLGDCDEEDIVRLEDDYGR